MTRNSRVTLEARVPGSATLELDRDNVRLTFVMQTPRLRVYVAAMNVFAVNFAHLSTL